MESAIRSCSVHTITHHQRQRCATRKYTPVSNDYQVPFRFTGRLTKLTLTIDRPKLAPEDEKRIMLEGQRNNRASE